MTLRIERLRELIRETAAEFILHELSDPRIGFCTVTRVDLTQDLSHCVVHVSVLGEEVQKRTTLRGLSDARGLLQSRIAGRLKTRTTPHVQIELDETIERTFRILEKIREARASDPDGGGTPGAELPAAEPPVEEPPAEEPEEKPKPKRKRAVAKRRNKTQVEK